MKKERARDLNEAEFLSLEKFKTRIKSKAELEEGYVATRQESQELCREFEAADLENWDEY